MTEAQTEHMNKIIEEFKREVSTKYPKGVEEHGGNLWDKTDLNEEALAESIDLFVYLSTLKQQNQFRNAQLRMLAFIVADVANCLGLTTTTILSIPDLISLRGEIKTKLNLICERES